MVCAFYAAPIFCAGASRPLFGADSAARAVSRVEGADLRVGDDRGAAPTWLPAQPGPHVSAAAWHGTQRPAEIGRDHGGAKSAASLSRYAGRPRRPERGE